MCVCLCVYMYIYIYTYKMIYTYVACGNSCGDHCFWTNPLYKPLRPKAAASTAPFFGNTMRQHIDSMNILVPAANQRTTIW